MGPSLKSNQLQGETQRLCREKGKRRKELKEQEKSRKLRDRNSWRTFGSFNRKHYVGFRKRKREKPEGRITKGEIERRKEKRERGRRNKEDRRKERMQRRQHGNMSSNSLCGKNSAHWLKVERPLFGTDPDRNRATWETPSSEAIPFRRKPLRRTRLLRNPAQTQVWSEQVWLNTTFISQGSRSWDKLAVET